MTAGSTYHMRVNNTIGYFALTGEKNYLLTEKSDREGFVEDATYRGFYAIARTCKKFANDSLESVRRAFDSYVKERGAVKKEGVPLTADASVEEVTSTLKAVDSFKRAAGDAVESLTQQLNHLQNSDEQGASEGSQLAVKAAERALQEISKLHSAVKTSAAFDAFSSLKQERSDQKEQVLALIESAAVGLSARGLAHELRTHLGEVRHRLTQISRSIDTKTDAGKVVQGHVQAIRASCSAIMSAASLIDPLLPRSRALRDIFTIGAFIQDYVSHRAHVFEREGISIDISGGHESTEVHVNRARMLQVIDNLVSNSIYWLRRGELTGELVGPKTISFVVTPVGYSVSDSGPGVDPHYEDSLFELFVTSKPDRDSGQGLGLFISRELLAMDGCSIRLTNERNSRARRYKFEVDLSNVRRS
jgi:signal transduction histidine kinase